MKVLILTDIGILFHGKINFCCSYSILEEKHILEFFSFLSNRQQTLMHCVYTLSLQYCLSFDRKVLHCTESDAFEMGSSLYSRIMWGYNNALYRRGTWPLCFNAVFVHNVEFHFTSVCRLQGENRVSFINSKIVWVIFNMN